MWKVAPFTRKLAHKHGFSTLHCNTLKNNADSQGGSTVAIGDCLAQCRMVEINLIIPLLYGLLKSSNIESMGFPPRNSLVLNSTTNSAKQLKHAISHKNQTQKIFWMPLMAAIPSLIFLMSFLTLGSTHLWRYFHAKTPKIRWLH